MKRFYLSLALCAAIASAFAQSGVLYQREMITPSGSTFGGAEDVIVDQTNSKAVGLLDINGSQPGTALVKYDLNSGTPLSAKLYFGLSTNPWNQCRVLAIGGNYYTLGGYTSNTGTMAIAKIDGTTGAVLFSKYIVSSITGLSPSLSVSDLTYDGSTYLYAVGTQYNTTQGQTDMWVAKIDLSGNLVWFKNYLNASWDEYPQNITAYSSTEIYIGGTTHLVGGSITDLFGLMVQIDNSGAVINSKHAKYWNGSPGGERMITYNLKRLGSNLYVVGQTLMGPDGAGPLIIGKYDLSMNNVVHTEYWGWDGGFMFNQEFYFTNNKILVPGNKNFYSSYTAGYVHGFFDLNTNFLNGNDLRLNDNLFGSIISYPASSGHIFSIAQNAVDNTKWYYIKGAPNNQHTSCDTAYTFNPFQDTLILTLHSLSVSGGRSLTMNTFTTELTDFALTNDVLCYYDPFAQRIAAPEENSVTIDELSVFPNPANTTLHLAIPSGTAQLSVYDLSGRMMYSSENPVETELSVNVAEWNSGVYLVRALMADGSVLTKRFVKE